jgi:hypothetical protein
VAPGRETEKRSGRVHGFGRCLAEARFLGRSQRWSNSRSLKLSQNEQDAREETWGIDKERGIEGEGGWRDGSKRPLDYR